MFRIAFTILSFSLAGASAQSVSELLIVGFTGKPAGLRNCIVGVHITGPKVASRVEPKLPADALQAKREGTVSITGVITQTATLKLARPPIDGPGPGPERSRCGQPMGIQTGFRGGRNARACNHHC